MKRSLIGSPDFRAVGSLALIYLALRMACLASDWAPDIGFWQGSGTVTDWKFWRMSGTNRLQTLVPSPHTTDTLIPGQLWRLVGLGHATALNFSQLHFQLNDPYGTMSTWYYRGMLRQSAWLTDPASPGTNSWKVQAVADFNHDGNDDLLFQYIETGSIYNGLLALWNMAGQTQVSTSWFYEYGTSNLLFAPTNWTVKAVGDMNQDGYVDLIWQHPNQMSSVWYLHGTAYTNLSGQFYHPMQLPPGWEIRGLADVNRDGQLDLVVQRTNSTPAYVKALILDPTNHLDIVRELPLNPNAADSNYRVFGFSRLGSSGTFNQFEDTKSEMLSAASTAGGVELNWRSKSTNQSVTVFRRNSTAGELTFTSVATLSGITNYTDVGGIATNLYEYKVSDHDAERHAFQGVSPPRFTSRGRVLLLVEEGLLGFPDFTSQLSAFRTDLQNEGWTNTVVAALRHLDGLRGTNWYQSNFLPIINNIRPQITSFYADNPNTTNLIFIIGHVTIPYSGFANTDGHPEHRGAWTCDAFYGNTNIVGAGGWTDTLTNAYWDANELPNVAGDGKFDNDSIPPGQVIGVGRIDFAKMPRWGTSTNLTISEVNLLIQYLQKDRSYRSGVSSPVLKRFVGMGTFNDPAGPDKDIYTNIVKIASRTAGIDVSRMIEDDFFYQTSESFLWGMLTARSGSGQDLKAYNITTGDNSGTHLSWDLLDPLAEPKGLFYVLQGSYLADFNHVDDMMTKGLLATHRFGLAVFPMSTVLAVPMPIEQMAGDCPIGLFELNLIKQAPTRYRWLGLLGDPTLRQF